MSLTQFLFNNNIPTNQAAHVYEETPLNRERERERERERNITISLLNAEREINIFL